MPRGLILFRSTRSHRLDHRDSRFRPPAVTFFNGRALEVLLPIFVVSKLDGVCGLCVVSIRYCCRTEPNTVPLILECLRNFLNCVCFGSYLMTCFLHSCLEGFVEIFFSDTLSSETAGRWRVRIDHRYSYTYLRIRQI